MGACLVVLAGVAAYLNSLDGPFVFDDIPRIVDNPHIRRFWEPLFSATRPFANWSFAWNYALDELRVGSYHVLNLLVHLAAGLVLFDLLRRTLKRGRLSSRYGRAAEDLALAAALLWIVHPLQTQAVTHIAQRSESLMGLFYLLTLYGFRRAVDSPWPGWWYVTSIASFILGMGCKEVMLTAPLMVAWYDRAFVAPSWRDAFRAHRAYYATLAGLWIVLGLIVVFHRGGHTAAEDALAAPPAGWLAYALSQPGVIAHYLRLALWPRGLCLDYNWPAAEGAWAIVPPLLLIVGLLAATAWCAVRRPGLGFVCGWFFVVLAPTSSVVPLVNLAGEHRMYLPLAAVTTLFVLAAYAVFEDLVYRRELPRPAAKALGGLLLLGCGTPLVLATFQRNSDYHSATAIWEDTAAKAPRNARAHFQLGLSLERLERIDEAIACYRRAVELRPESAEAQRRLAGCLLRSGQVDEAIGHYEKALQIEPGVAQAHYELGDGWMRKGRFDQAASEYEKAVEIQSDYADAYNNLGIALMQMGKIDQAITQYEKAVEVRPAYADAHHNLGVALLQAGEIDNAIKQLEKATEVRADYAEAYYWLGVVASRQGDLDKAMGRFRRVLELKPQHAEAHNNLGVALIQQGKVEEAIAQWRQAVAIKSDYAEARNNLGKSLFYIGKTDEAIEHYQKALEVNPGYADAHNNLGEALSRKGMLDQAIEHYRQAVEIKPDFAVAHNNLGLALMRRGRLSEATLQLQKAMGLDPHSDAIQYNLGLALERQGRLDEAILRYRTALRLNPQYGKAHNSLAEALYRCGRFAEALDHWRTAVRLQPNDPAALNSLAWLLATGSDGVRNAQEAVRHAQRACELTKNDQPALLDTLAAAYAEAGRFAEATETAQQALKLADQRKNITLAEGLTTRLKLYQSGKPYRDKYLAPQREPHAEKKDQPQKPPEP